MSTIRTTDLVANPSEGEAAWRVTSCRSMPADKAGQAAVDEAVYFQYIIPDEMCARIMADKLLPDDDLGEVEIEPVVWERYERSLTAGRWVPDGDPEFISNPTTETTHRVADAIERGE